MKNLQSNTKQKILDISESLLVKRGFNGFSYKHISSLLGIKNAAIHYHYPTKSDLGVELVMRSRARFQDWAEDIESQGLNPSQKMDAFIDLYKELLKSEDRFFFVTALESNYKILPEKMQHEAKMLSLEYLSWLEKVLKEGREDGTFSYKATDSDQARAIWSILNGTMFLVLIVHGSCLDSAIKTIKTMLGK